MTASLAHYDIMHLGFNMMSLYNLGKPRRRKRLDDAEVDEEMGNRASLFVQPLTSR